MSRSGDEMVLELAALLGNDMVKNAAKDNDDKKEDKKEKAEKDKKEKADKKDDKKKNAFVMVRVLQDLTKLASELDKLGADSASGLVDDALRVIVANLEKKKVIAELGNPEDVGLGATEMFEEEDPVTGREEGAGSRVEHTLQESEEGAPEGLGMGMEDKMDQLTSEERATLKELLGKLV